ncbi:hypothetical protein D6T26_24940 [Salmonella enterica subsp. enterica serovar Typhi]|nr:hypothetical protein [Salmonella enterica subsp. enterica serovar Typhi]
MPPREPGRRPRSPSPATIGACAHRAGRWCTGPPGWSARCAPPCPTTPCPGPPRRGRSAAPAPGGPRTRPTTSRA